MRLREGFILANRYRITGPGSAPGAFTAESLGDGPGRVEVRVPRYDRAQEPADYARLRAEHERVFDRLLDLQREGCGVVTPIERIQSYCADPDLRPLFRDLGLVQGEIYHVVSHIDAPTLLSFAQAVSMDEERALLVALRVLLLLRRAAARGLRFDRVDPEGFRVEPQGDDVVCVDASCVHRGAQLGEFAEDLPLDGERVPADMGRVMLLLLTGVRAPDWAPDDPRWPALLDARRVGREYHALVLGALGRADGVRSTWDEVENRLRSLARAFRERVRGSAARAVPLSELVVHGTLIGGRFEVRGELAQGARGRILLARDRASGGEVVVKLTKYRYDSAEEFALELPTRRAELEHEYRVLRELADATSMVPQPIALVHDRARGGWFDLAPQLAAGEPFLVMERLPGRSLLDLLPEGRAGYASANDPNNRLSAVRVIRIVERLAALLEVVHGAGYLYQDLKPENVLFCPVTEALSLVDFASACPRDARGTLDRTSVAFGMQTHGYAAPEFGALWERVDDRFDLYSLGALAWHLLTGVSPERVAVEQGKEYPELRLDLLRDVPAPVVDVVSRCLADRETRLGSAAEVRVRAAAARLMLSRSRPMDVRDLDASWEDGHVVLTWTLPDDPRVQRVRVIDMDGERPTVLADAHAGTRFADPRPLDTDRRYRVETLLVRRGEVLHARGVERTVASRPAPLRLEVRRDFGALHVDVRVAGHATGVEVRWSRTMPPTQPDEGEPLLLDADGQARHAIDPTGPVHYAAFARYHGGVSAPRFASATALAPLPSVAITRVTQTDEGVTLHIDPLVDGVRVTACRAEDEDAHEDAAAARGEERSTRDVPRWGDRFVDADAARGLPVTYRVHVVREGVRSGALASTTITRWPEPPSLVVREDIGAFVLATTPEHDPTSWRRVEVRAVTDAGRRLDHVLTSGEPARIELPEGGAVTLRVRGILAGTDAGPARQLRIAIPPADLRLLPEVVDAEHPARVRVRLPRAAQSWTGGWSLRSTIVAASTRTRRADLVSVPVEAMVVDDGELQAEWVLDRVPVNEATRWEVSLVGPGTEAPTAAHLRVVATRRLPPVELIPELGALRVVPTERVDAPCEYDVTDDEGNVRHAGPLPAEGVRVSLPPGVLVVGRWRLTAVDGEMPWSPPARARVLRTPEPPRAVRVRVTSEGTWIDVELGEWDDEPPGIRVVDGAGRLVYEGEALRCLDLAEPVPSAYCVVTTARGLASAAVHAEVARATHEGAEGDAASPGAGASEAATDAGEARRAGAPRSAVTVRPGDAELRRERDVLRAVRVSGWCVVEVVGPPTPWTAVAFGGGTRADVDAARAVWLKAPVGSTLEARTAAASSRGLVATQAGVGARELLVLPGRAAHVAMVVSEGHGGGGPWRAVGPVHEVVPGELVGASLPRPDRLVLRVRSSVAGRLAALRDVGRLMAWERGAMRPLRLHDVEPWAEGRVAALAGTLEASSEPRQGLTLAPERGGDLLLVPMVAEELHARIDERIWVDAIRSAQRETILALAAAFPATVATLSTGVQARADLLVGAEHVRVEWGAPRRSPAGTLRVDLRMVARRGHLSVPLRLDLCDPVARTRTLRTWSHHVRARWRAQAPIEEKA